MSFQPCNNSRFVLLLLVALSRAVVASTCYYSNGDVDSQAHPCNATSVESGGHSSCCHANDVCWSDGSCSTYSNNIPYWMSCTDRNWEDSSCPKIGCGSQVADDAETWLIKCNPYNGSTCCLRGGTTCCDDDTSNFFTYEPGSVTASLNDFGVNVLFVTSTGAASSSAATDSTSGTPTSTSSSSTGQASTSSQGNNNSHTGEIALGAVLGVVVIAAVFGITALWVKLRAEKGRRQRAETELDSMRGTASPGYMSSAMVATNTGSSKTYYAANVAAQTQELYSAQAQYLDPSAYSPRYHPSELPTANGGPYQGGP